MNQNLWAPWRMEYLQQLVSSEPNQESGGCFLCNAAAADESTFERLLVLRRDQHGLLMLNRYPYTNGHLLVAPATHLPTLVDLDPQQRAGLMELTALAQRLLTAAINPQGLNIGMNIGRCAGAGVPGHLHVHIVPRWNGDTNFMPVIGHVRVIPQALEETYRHFSEVLAKLS